MGLERQSEVKKRRPKKKKKKRSEDRKSELFLFSLGVSVLRVKGNRPCSGRDLDGGRREWVTVQERGKSRAYRLALNKRKAIVTLKWTRGASVAVNPGMCVNAHSAQPVQATRKRVLVYLQYLLWSFGDDLHFRRDRGICPDRPFSTSPVRSPGVAALVRCQGNSWF